MIEVCSCLSSELFQAAALSEHAPDEVSQDGEKAVITGRLEGCSIRQIAVRCVRHTHTAPVGVWVVLVIVTEPALLTDRHRSGPLSFQSLCLLFFLFLSLFFSSERKLGVRENHWQVSLNIYAYREKTRMLSPTRLASISTHALTQPLTWNICSLKPYHDPLETKLKRHVYQLKDWEPR